MPNQKLQELQTKKRDSGLTYESIAQASGIPLSTVQKVLGGKINAPRPDTIAALERVLNAANSSTAEISIGNQDFAAIIENKYFYVDKTLFIKQWWESADVVTLITRPRRFGKTLNLSMLNYFFSNKYSNGEELFSSLSIWNFPEYKALCNQFPVLLISFASVKGTNYETARQQIIQEIVGLYRNNSHLYDAPFMSEMDTQWCLSLLTICEQLFERLDNYWFREPEGAIPFETCDIHWFQCIIRKRQKIRLSVK